jgi:MFS family permease
MIMPKKRVIHKNYVLLIIAVAQFMVVLDTSIVNVALPSIAKALHFTSDSNLQWVVTAYTLASVAFCCLVAARLTCLAAVSCLWVQSQRFRLSHFYVVWRRVA